ncbi:hypothetical protein NQ314_008776 [Rhamnusium bicolor]|uniref:H15 domain-containing protein n=1 Tax=Rhamnusium bicolor TaxID=1586634 RepID=A0AAV8Y5P4_9CUCU|nr:hypothetical protein NQ314_008776 [Rhamnusium bicolor]
MLFLKTIGGSQGKFCPKTTESNSSMKRSGHQPRLLTAVMEAIANLKDGKGSTQKRIIDQVQCLLNSKNVSLRNVTVHIRKALKHGVESGLIKQKGGKFKLGLDTKDYAIFKSFQKNG